MAVTMSDRGFSLIEVLVALAILTIGLLGILNLSFYTIRTNKHSRELMWARLLAEKTAQNLQIADYDSDILADDADTSDLDDTENPDHISMKVNTDDDNDGRIDEELPNGLDDDGDGKIDEDLLNYSVFWNIADGVPSTATKTIRIIAQWQKGDVTHSVKINIVRGRYKW